jgi:aminoglycoside phosphotransferase (APT) family kinase protein
MLETIPVRADEQFSLAAVSEFLAVSGLPSHGLEVEQFPLGHSNLTYLLKTDKWEAVLRRPPLGPVAPRAHDMVREYHLLERLHPVFPVAPRPYARCEDASVIGAPFYIMERRHGIVLDRDLPADWHGSSELHRGITESLVRVLVELHGVDWQPAGLGAIGHPEGYMQRQVTGWIDRFGRVRTFELPEVEPLQRWLVNGLPISPAPTVIHNDYKLNNVLLDVGDPRRITGVLDWEMATVGDPLSDVASLLVYWTEPGDEDMLGGLKSVTSEPGFPRRAEVASLYAKLSGRDLGGLDWYVAFAYFKVAVICQQIFYRWKVGQTRDERFAGHEAVARNLVLKAAEVARVAARD